jgi:glutaredoxin 3
MFTVYSKPACPQCDMAKSIIKAKGYNYTEIILDVGQLKAEGVTYISRDELLTKVPGARMMPQIFNEDRHIGSLIDLKGEFA